MDRGSIDLTIVSGTDIKRGSLFGADKKIVVAWLDPKQKHFTKAAEREGSTPVWNYKLLLPLCSAARTLKIEIRSKGSFGDTLLGTVHIPVADIAMDGTKGANKKLTYLVEQPSGKRHGSLNLFAKIVNSQSYAANSPANFPAIVPLSEKISSHAPSQTNLGSAPLYPPPESYLAERYKAEQPYPPAESVYPPPYPSSQPAFDTMKPAYTPNETIYSRPPSWGSSEYSGAAPSYDCYRPTPYPPPRPQEYSVTAYPPAAPHEYPVTAYPPTAPPEYSVTAYPPAAPPEYSVTAYPPSVPLYPPSQHHSCAPRYPPLCGTYPYPYSYSN